MLRGGRRIKRDLVSLISFLSLSFLTSCIAPLTPHNFLVRLGSDKPLEQRLESSKELIEKRKKQAYDYTLAEKAAIFEQERDFFKLGEPFTSIREGDLRGRSKLSGSFSFLSEELLMLSFKYKATLDEGVRKEVSKCLDAFLLADDNFGRKGQLPKAVFFSKYKLNEFEDGFHKYYLYGKGGKNSEDFIYFMDDAHGNTMPQHFHALYFLNKFFEDKEVKEKVIELTDRHINYLLDVGFTVKILDGNNATYAGITGEEYFGFAKNSFLSRVTILEIAKHIIEGQNNEDVKFKDSLQRINNEINGLKESGKIQAIEDITPNIANFSFSSTSGDKRMFFNYFILADIERERGGGNYFKELSDKYWIEKRELFNSLFAFLYLGAKPKNAWSFQDRFNLAVSLEYFKSFPLDRNNSEILNSFFEDEDIEINRFPEFYKSGLKPRNKMPLPVYRRGIRENEFTRNQHRLNENIGKDGGRFYIPNDFLTAYYTALANDFIPLEQQEIDKTKVDSFLEEVKPLFESVMYK